MLRFPREKMLRGLTDGLSECDSRRNGGEGVTGGHWGLMFKDLHKIEMIVVQMLAVLIVV